MIKKKLKKRFLFIGVGILAIISLVVTLVIILNHNKEDEFQYRGVHYENFEAYLENTKGRTNVSLSQPFILYRIDIEEDNYKYGEEFTIEYQFGINSLFSVNYIEEGDLKITFQAEDFEILSPLEYEYKDFIPENNYIRYDENNNRIYPNKLEIRLKAITESASLEEILILIDFNLGRFMMTEYEDAMEECGEEMERFSAKLFWDMEFTKDCQFINNIYYINDSFGTLLGSAGKRDYKFNFTECGCEEGSECNHKFENLRSREIILYRSLNRSFKNNLISKEEYMNELNWCCQDKRGFVEKKSELFIYKTKNFQSELLLDEAETNELNELYKSYKTKHYSEIAKRLVTILNEEGKITLEEYEAEMQIIKTKGIPVYSGFYNFIYKLIPFEIDDVNYYREIYVERK